MSKAVDIGHILEFLPCETPPAWVYWALDNHDLMLVDHANCEKKAASTALNLMYRYVDHHTLLNKMSKLAREELRHAAVLGKAAVKRKDRFKRKDRHSSAN